MIQAMKKIALLPCVGLLVLGLSACQSAAPVQSGNGGLKAAVPDNVPVPAGYHRVQRGENLYRIGLRYNQTVSTLSRWNQLSNPGQIEVGQLLRVSNNVTSSPRRNNTNTATNTSQTNKTASKPAVSWSAPSTAANITNVRLMRPVNGSVLANFNGGSNKGMDFGGQRGDAVKAAAAGKVVYAGDGLRGYGNLVMVQHTQTLLTVYAHNDRISVKEGDQVKQGQQIATMGSTGTDSVKLHFEVRQDGKAVNPNSYW